MNDAGASGIAAGPDARPVERPFDPLRIGLRVAAISAFVGLSTTLLDPNFDAAFINILYSECIGLSVFAIYVAMHLAWHRDEWSFRDHAIRATIAIPLGFAVGVNLGAALSGHRIGVAAFNDMAPFSMVLTAFTSVGFIYFSWSRQRLAENATARAEAQRVAAEAQLRLLQTQIEPHMLFNTLANLRTLIDVDAPRAQAMVDELIVYLRSTLAASRRPMTTLAGEFAQLRAYLELMTVRMAHRLAYELDLPAALADASIPPMLLQPLVENAIKHGLEPKIAGGTVRVTVRAEADRLAIDVVDDGIGIGIAADAHADPTAADGYGLAHVRERLATVYGAAATLATGPGRDGGFVVSIGLPRRPLQPVDRTESGTCGASR